MKRVINAAAFFLLLILLFAFAGVTVDSLTDFDFGEAFIGFIFTYLTFRGVRSTYRKAFGDHPAQTQPQNPELGFNPEMDRQLLLQQQQQMMQDAQNNMTFPPLPPSGGMPGM